MSDTIRMAVVGFGRYLPQIGTPDIGSYTGRGEGYLKIATKFFPNIEPVAVCDINPQALEQARIAFPGAKLYEDFDGMLAKGGFDALIIATSAYLHTKFAVAALNRDIHVLSEIPCVNSLEEAWELWEAQEKSKAFYMTAENSSMAGFIEAGVDLKKRGLLGEPFYIETFYSHDLRRFHTDKNATELYKKMRTYERIRYCTHSLGPVLRLMKEQEFETVTCFSTFSHINNYPGEHDVMSAQLRTKSNVVVHLMASHINNYPNKYCHGYKFYTTKGAFERTINYGTQALFESASEARTLFYSTELYGHRRWTELPVGLDRPGQTKEMIAMGHGGRDYAVMELFLNAIRSNGPLSPLSLRDGLCMTLPGIFAAASAANGGKLYSLTYPWMSAKPPKLD